MRRCIDKCPKCGGRLILGNLSMNGGWLWSIDDAATITLICEKCGRWFDIISYFDKPRCNLYWTIAEFGGCENVRDIQEH